MGERKAVQREVKNEIEKANEAYKDKMEVTLKSGDNICALLGKGPNNDWHACKQE